MGEKTILGLLVAALAGFLVWWWWRGRAWSPMPGESATTPGATQAQWLAPDAPGPGAPVVFKFAPVASAATVGREWAPGYDDGKRGSVSVNYTNKSLGFA